MKVNSNYVYVDKFDSLNSFLNAINSRPLNKVFEGYDTKRGSNSPDSAFSKTKSYEESEEIMRTGYKEGLENMKKAAKNVQVSVRHPKAVPMSNIIGSTPHVPNAIAGIPSSMIDYKKVPMKSKMISLVYDVTANADVDASVFIKAGRVLLSFIEMMEVKGYRVKLDMMLSSCKGKEISVALVKVKDFRQPVNPLKLSYMMVHPAFLRRQGLKWVETNPRLTDSNFRRGHGCALYFQCGNSTRTEERFLKENNIIDDKSAFISLFDLRGIAPEEVPGKVGLKC